MSGMVVNVSHQNCDSMRFLFLKNCILMNSKQNYSGGRRGAINYSWDCLRWANDPTVELLSYFKNVFQEEGLPSSAHCREIVEAPALQLLEWGSRPPAPASRPSSLSPLPMAGAGSMCILPAQEPARACDRRWRQQAWPLYVQWEKGDRHKALTWHTPGSLHWGWALNKSHL